MYKLKILYVYIGTTSHRYLASRLPVRGHTIGVTPLVSHTIHANSQIAGTCARRETMLQDTLAYCSVCSAPPMLMALDDICMRVLRVRACIYCTCVSARAEFNGRRGQRRHTRRSAPQVWQARSCEVWSFLLLPLLVFSLSIFFLLPFFALVSFMVCRFQVECCRSCVCQDLQKMARI